MIVNVIGGELSQEEIEQYKIRISEKYSGRYSLRLHESVRCLSVRIRLH